MLDRLLAFGCIFDWITPSVAFVQDIAYGPSTPFFVPYDVGWSGGEIKRLLQRHGIQVWGLMTVDKSIMFSVRRHQARRTLWLLSEAGIPIEQYGKLEERKKQGRGRLGRLMYG